MTTILSVWDPDWAEIYVRPRKVHPTLKEVLPSTYFMAEAKWNRV
jgi:hypothetical protein